MNNIKRKTNPLGLVFRFGGASTLKFEPFGRATNFRLAGDFRTDWVQSPSVGGDGGDRTHDLLNAIQALSQLSYAPKN